MMRLHETLQEIQIIEGNGNITENNDYDETS
jgi:hypothetical protein